MSNTSIIQTLAKVRRTADKSVKFVSYRWTNPLLLCHTVGQTRNSCVTAWKISNFCYPLSFWAYQNKVRLYVA
jgi:hypothetical protein